jgi:hypothetical protein
VNLCRVERLMNQKGLGRKRSWYKRGSILEFDCGVLEGTEGTKEILRSTSEVLPCNLTAGYWRVLGVLRTYYEELQRYLVM